MTKAPKSALSAATIRRIAGVIPAAPETEAPTSKRTVTEYDRGRADERRAIRSALDELLDVGATRASIVARLRVLLEVSQ